MEVLDRKLHDALISYQLDLRRLEAGTRSRVLALFDKLVRELSAELSGPRELTKLGKARRKELIRQIELLTGNFYKSAQLELTEIVEGLAEAQATHAAKILAGTVPITVNAVLPSDTMLTRIARDVLIDGGPVASWWNKLAVDTSFRVGNAIRQGVVQGETNAQVITRVAGKPGTVGALDTARHNIAALVHTVMQTVANDSRLAVFDANKDIIKEYEWFSAMDGHVCPRCIALSGRRWKNNKAHDPIGHTVPFRNPPIHWNDRCVLLPITKSFKELGVDINEVPPGERASRFGPISSRTTFDEFLKRMPESQQNEMLGVGRAQLWRDGKITLAQLIDGKGRELTLAELKDKYD